MILFFWDIWFIPIFFIFLGLINIIHHNHNKYTRILLLLSIEFTIIGIFLSFFLLSILSDDFLGFYFSIFLITIAAAESAIGLSIIISMS